MQCGNARIDPSRAIAESAAGDEVSPVVPDVILLDWLPAEDGPAEAVLQVNAGTYPVNLFHRSHVIDEKPPGLDLGIGLGESVQQIAIGEIAIGIVVAGTPLVKVDAPPSGEVKGEVAVGCVAEVDGKKLGGGNQVLFGETGNGTFFESKQGCSIYAYFRRFRHLGQQRQGKGDDAGNFPHG